MILDSLGIYNGQADDYDGDGDMDILRLQKHDANAIYIMVNQLKQPQL